MEIDINKYEKGNGAISISENYASLIQCSYKECDTRGDYYKCYFDNLFEQCSIFVESELVRII